MNRIETKQKGVSRDIRSKALLPSAKSPEYREYLNQKAMNDRLDRLEEKFDRLMDMLAKGTDQ